MGEKTDRELQQFPSKPTVSEILHEGNSGQRHYLYLYSFIRGNCTLLHNVHEHCFVLRKKEDSLQQNETVETRSLD